MRLAIDLYNQLAFMTREIYVVRADRLLSAKLESFLPSAQFLPQQTFRWRQWLSQFAGAIAALRMSWHWGDLH